MSSISEIAREGTLELAKAVEDTNDAQLTELEEAILGAANIYVEGTGRSLLALRFFAMRLMHLGLSAYVVGDTTTPAFTKRDLLIVASGSGRTAGVLNIAAKAHSLGGKVAAFTIQSESPLADCADIVVKVAGYTNKMKMDVEPPIFPSGALFEISTLLVCEALVVSLGEKLGVDLNEYFVRHANLE